MHRWLVGMLALVTLSGCGPAGQGAGTTGRHRPRRRRRPPHRDQPAGRHGRGRGGECVRPRPLPPHRRAGPDGQRRPLAGEHRPRAGDGPRRRTRPDRDRDGRGAPRVRHGRPRGMAGRAGRGADRPHRHVHGPERRAGRRHPAHRQRPVRRSLPAAGAGLPRRPRCPVRRRPSPGRLQVRSRRGEGPCQRLGRRPDRAANSRAAAAGNGRRPDSPGARERRLPQGGVAVPVRRRRHERGSVHDPGGNDGQRAADARHGRVRVRVGSRMEGGPAARMSAASSRCS